MAGEADFESPGYEFLRTYQNMNNLYYKLIALDYQRQFCSKYRCPSIDRYYFAAANKNPAEQKYIFVSLCSWLMKEKCLMNFDLDPEEYESDDVVAGVIYEALRLLVESEDDNTSARSKPKASALTFPPGRLRTGHGPEAIWAMNVLADRALELMIESGKQIDSTAIQVAYITSRVSSATDTNTSNKGNGFAKSITIGQPYVGGSLTTRPLGNYQIDDESLLLDSRQKLSKGLESPSLGDNKSREDYLEIDPLEWYSLVSKAAPILESGQVLDSGREPETWDELMATLSKAKDYFKDLVAPVESSKTLEALAAKLERQFQSLGSGDQLIGSNLGPKIEACISVWRSYLKLRLENDSLLEQINQRTDMFEALKGELDDANGQIVARIKELNDGSDLKELKSSTELLESESQDLGLKLNLLLTLYPEIHAKLLSSIES